MNLMITKANMFGAVLRSMCRICSEQGEFRNMETSMLVDFLFTFTYDFIMKIR